jgi:hypothetical protein
LIEVEWHHLSTTAGDLGSSLLNQQRVETVANADTGKQYEQNQR